MGILKNLARGRLEKTLGGLSPGMREDLHQMRAMLQYTNNARYADLKYGRRYHS